MMAGALGAVRRHWLFALVLSLGTALRGLAWAAYQPALFYSDSVNYLANTYQIPNSGWHPLGYPVFLDLLLWGHHLAVVSAVQHLLVIADAVVIYLLLLRLGGGRIVATLAIAPLLLDAYQVQIEQYILSEAFFETLLTAAAAIALWPSREGIRTLSWRRSAGVAVLLGLSVLVRLDALGLVVPLVGWLIWTSWRHRAAKSPRPVRSAARSRLWLPIVAAAIAFALPIAVLVGIRDARGNGASVSGMGPIWLYSRVAPFANCASDDPPVSQRALCPTQPLGHRPGSIFFQNSYTAPEWRYLVTHPGDTGTVESFARRVIEHQPLDYLHAVAVDFDHQFRPTRAQTPAGPEVVSWQFRLTLTPVDSTKPVPQTVVDQFGTGKARIDVGLARVLHDYQRYGYLPGPVMLFLLLGSAIVLVVRRRHPLAPALLLLLGSAVMVVLIATATVLFSWRYMLPTLLLYPPAGAVAWIMLRTPVRVGEHAVPNL
jgi:hypothetical protein